MAHSISRSRSSSSSASSEATLRRAYEAVRAEADALPAHEVRAPWTSTSIARANAARGVDAVLAEKAVWAGQLGLSVAATKRVLEYAAAAEYATISAMHAAAPASGFRAEVSRAAALRKLLLASARSLALAGVMPKEAVERIAKGSGATDLGRDLVALAELFGSHAKAARGKSPVTAEMRAEAEALGAALLEKVRGKGAKRPVHAEVRAAQGARDRAWTLFERAWERNVWLPGALVWKRRVDEHVPPLGTRVAAKRAPKKAPVDGPSPKG